jgi:hypothetical protein
MGDYTLRLSMHGKRLYSPLMPYFWDNDIVFDLVCHLPPREEEGVYHWALVDLDGVVQKSGQGEFRFSRRGVTRRLLPWGIVKDNAISLGDLKPDKRYRLKLTLATRLGQKTQDYEPISLTIEDRDHFYLDIWRFVIGAIIGLVCSVIGAVVGFIIGYIMKG